MKKKAVGEWRQTSALICLFPHDSFTAHVREDREKNVMALFLVTVAVKKKRKEKKEKHFSISSPPMRPSFPPWKNEEHCHCPSSLCSVLPSAKPLASSCHPPIPLVCLYYCSDALSRGCIIHFSTRDVAHWVRVRGKRRGGKRGIKKQSEGAMLRAPHLKLGLFKTWPSHGYSFNILNRAS